MIKNKYVAVFSYLIVILGVLIGAHYLLKPVETRSKAKLYESKYQGFMDDLKLLEVLDVSNPIISEKILAEAGGVQVTLYGAKLSNDYGEIEIIVALDANGKVIEIKAIKIDQSRSDKILGELNDLIVNMKDLTVNTPPGNVAQATIGSITIKNILEAIYEEHFLGIDEIQLLLGRGTSLGKKVEINQDGIISKQPILRNGEEVGNIYQATTPVDSDMVFEAYVYVDSDNNLLYYQIINYESSVENPTLPDISILLDIIKGGN